MKAAYLTSANALLVKNGKPVGEEKILEVKACGICQADRKAFSGPPAGMRLPRILGHEFAGVLQKDIPSQSLMSGTSVVLWPALCCGGCSFCQAGMENLCQQVKIFGYHRDGGFCDGFYCTPDEVNRLRIVELPSAMSFADAVFAEPLACVLNAMEKVTFRPEKCLVYGLGVIGRLAIRAMKHYWQADICAYDIDPHRQESAAKECGRFPAGEKADLVLLAASSRLAFEEALNVLAPGGMILLFSGLPRSQSKQVTIPYNDLHQKEQQLVGAYGCTPSGMKQAVALISAGEIVVRDLLSRKVSLEELPDLFCGAGQSELKVSVSFE